MKKPPTVPTERYRIERVAICVDCDRVVQVRNGRCFGVTDQIPGCGSQSLLFPERPSWLALQCFERVLVAAAEEPEGISEPNLLKFRR